eukprot:Sspe_Gene.69445::Locus_40934_Transcript_1_1_Confidence_1.000_Length_1039::g.69445::m.69445
MAPPGRERQAVYCMNFVTLDSEHSPSPPVEKRKLRSGETSFLAVAPQSALECILDEREGIPHQRPTKRRGQGADAQRQHVNIFYPAETDYAEHTGFRRKLRRTNLHNCEKQHVNLFDPSSYVDEDFHPSLRPISAIWNPGEGPYRWHDPRPPRKRAFGGKGKKWLDDYIVPRKPRPPRQQPPPPVPIPRPLAVPPQRVQLNPRPPSPGPAPAPARKTTETSARSSSRVRRRIQQLWKEFCTAAPCPTPSSPPSDTL